jgi:AraC-like DNA-binding protein
MLTRTIAVNALGRRVGDSHHHARLTNDEVDRLLDLHEQEGWGYKRLAAVFDISRSAARNICKGRSRCQVAVQWRRVVLGDNQ